MNEPQSEDTCFILMEKVGTSGRYQCLSLVLWCSVWFVTGLVLMGTPFLVYDPPYQCQDKTQEQCLSYVCSLDETSREQYNQQNELYTLANAFGDYHCSRHILELVASLVYIGSFCGYISISLVVDNIGRKKGMLLSYGIGTIGMLIVGFSQNLIMAGIGLFFSGLGCNTAVNICFYFITETVENKLRQKHSVLIQAIFSLAGVLNVLAYYFIRRWRFIYWGFYIIPSILIVIAVFFFIKETPFFLIVNSTEEKALESLKKIAEINNFEHNDGQLLSLIQELKKKYLKNSNQNEVEKEKRSISPLDLFRYKSLRKISIFICLISFIIYFLNYGPLMLIDKFGFNIYVNALVVTFSALAPYPFFYWKVQKMPRKKAGIILFGIAMACSVILIFVNSDCEGNCAGKIVEMILIFIFRFVTCLQFPIFLVFSNEIFPTQIRGMGMGISSALGTVASSSIPYITGQISQEWIMMLMFAILAFFTILMIYGMPQTLDRKIEDEIQELKNNNIKIEDKNKSSLNKDVHIELVQENHNSER